MIRNLVRAGTAVAAAFALVGCERLARDELPADLGGAWIVQQIAGASLGENVQIYFEVDAKTGRISGFTGCNRFTASMQSFSRALAVGSIQEQAADCPSAAAATDETRFLRVLPSVQRYVRHGQSLELLPRERGEALLRLRVDNMATLTEPAPHP